ncbi:MAG: sigma-E processing peptidase SpoIIGA [Solirubrobacterales bacterium]
MPQSAPVYLDILFATNLVMDAAVLWASGRVAGVAVIPKRLLVASILGAVYAVGAVIPEAAGFYSLQIKLVFSGLLVLFAFEWSGFQHYLKLWAVFFLVSFAMAGAATGVQNLIQSEGAQGQELMVLSLGGGLACAAGLGLYGEKAMRERLIPGLLQCPVHLRFGDTVLESTGFIDTGHQLVDPLTKKPVVIAEYDLLKTCLPGDIRQVFDENASENDIFQVLTETDWAHRIRLIPFTSIGRQHGLLVGVRCDEFTVRSGERWQVFPGLVVGVYRGILHPEGAFRVLLPASILR